MSNDCPRLGGRGILMKLGERDSPKFNLNLSPGASLHSGHGLGFILKLNHSSYTSYKYQEVSAPFLTWIDCC